MDTYASNKKKFKVYSLRLAKLNVGEFNTHNKDEVKKPDIPYASDLTPPQHHSQHPFFYSPPVPKGIAAQGMDGLMGQLA
jgi:hypothetical protein